MCPYHKYYKLDKDTLVTSTQMWPHDLTSSPEDLLAGPPEVTTPRQV